MKISPAFAAPDTPTGSWTARVRLAKPADFPALLAEWDTAFPQETEHDEARAKSALEWMFGVWLTRDMDGFLTTVFVPDFTLSEAAAAALVPVMSEKAAALVAEPAQNDTRYFISFLSAELAQRHPVLYLKVVPVPEDPYGSPWAAAIAALAKTDPRAAADICLHAKIEDPSRLESPLFTALLAWRDGDAALADWMAGIADPDLRRVAEQARLSLLAKGDPRAALEKLASMDLGEPLYSPDGKDARLEIAAQLAKADPAAAIQLLKDMEGVFAKFASGNPDPFAEPSAATPGKTPGPFGVFNFGGSESPEENPLRKAIVAALAKYFRKPSPE